MTYAPAALHWVGLLPFALTICVVYGASRFETRSASWVSCFCAPPDYKEVPASTDTRYTVKERWTIDASSYSYMTVSTLYGDAKNSLTALGYVAMVIALQLALLRLYGIDADKKAGQLRADFGEIPRPGVIYDEATKDAMSFLNISSAADINDDTELNTRFELKRDELYDSKLTAASISFRSGMPLKLATYTVTGIIMLLFAGSDIVNGARLIMFHARLCAIRRSLRSGDGVFRGSVALSFQDGSFLTRDLLDPEDNHSGTHGPLVYSLAIALVLMAVSVVQVVVATIVLEYCVFATITEADMSGIVLNFLSLTFILELDDKVLTSWLFKPSRVQLLCDENTEQDLSLIHI